jgi:hypothetical protein
MRLLELLESRLTGSHTGTDVLCRKSVASLRQYLSTRADSDPALAELATAIRGWQTDMERRGIKPLTQRRYVESLRALYNKAVAQGLAETDGVFNQVLAALHGGGAPAVRPQREAAPPTVHVDCLRQLVQRAPSRNRELDLMRDVFVYSLYHAGLEPEAIPALTASPTGRDCAQAAAIVERYAAPRRKYLFPLSQGRTTDHRIALTLQARIPAVLTYLGYPEAVPFTRQAVRALWTEVARRCRIPDADIRAALGEADDEVRDEVLGTVADYLNDSTPQWYAMKLRRGVTPDDIQCRLADEPTRADRPLQTYYPCEEITRRVGKKLKHTTRAYISEVLFFRVPFYEILPLFRLIGDMAWCYRTANTPGAPYAVIHDLDRFQRCVGQLTPDMQVEPLDDADLGVGQTVRITGGCMEGYEGQIFSLPKADGATTDSTKRLFKLKLISDKGLKITVDIPEYYIEKLDK